jgi:hypothetical protein
MKGNTVTEDTWNTIAMPILGFVSAHETEVTSGSVASIAKDLSIDPLMFEAEFDRLKRDSYIDGNIYKQAGMDPDRWRVNSLRLLAKGARAIEQWPDTDKVYELLVELVDRQIALAANPEVKGRLEKAKDMLTNVGISTISTVLSTLLVSGIH